MNTKSINPFQATRPDGHSSIVREWVESLSPRIQGTLLTIIRGCDVAERNEGSKHISRVIRGLLLHSMTDPPSSFIKYVDWTDPTALMQFKTCLDELTSSHDHLPHHFLMHLIHASEIIGWKHPNPIVKMMFCGFYHDMCRKMHMHAESEGQLDVRLNADENTFSSNQ